MANERVCIDDDLKSFPSSVGQASGAEMWYKLFRSVWTPKATLLERLSVLGRRARVRRNKNEITLSVAVRGVGRLLPGHPGARAEDDTLRYGSEPCTICLVAWQRHTCRWPRQPSGCQRSTLSLQGPGGLLQGLSAGAIDVFVVGS